MAVLCLKQLEGLWQIAHDPEAYSYISPELRDPAHAVTLHLAMASSPSTWPSGAGVGAKVPVIPTPLPLTSVADT
eukprot:10313749-Prorocentrum_lima.AAC.1